MTDREGDASELRRSSSLTSPDDLEHRCSFLEVLSSNLLLLRYFPCSAPARTASRLLPASTLKAPAVLSVVASLLAAAVKFWQCTVSLFGAAKGDLAVDGAAASRRLAGYDECVSFGRACCPFFLRWSEWRSPG